jgi:hypothetical protein
MNLVMIGRFEDAKRATTARTAIEQITQQVDADVGKGLMEIGERADRFTDSMLDLLKELNLYSLGSAELEQFGYDVSVEQDDTSIVVTTDEIDVSAYMKILLDNGARVEVFSAHDYPGTGYGRGAKTA